jgi:hypothetical protein
MDYNIEELDVIIYNCENHNELFHVCDLIDEYILLDTNEIDLLKEYLFEKHIDLLK